MTSTSPESTRPLSRELSRRRVIRTVAWSVPVVAVAVALPQAAASGTMTLAVTSGDVDPGTLNVRFAGVAAGDAVPLSISVTDPNGTPVTDGFVASLSGAGGIAAWSPDNEGQVASTDLSGSVVGGSATLILEALGAFGTFSVLIVVGAQSWVLSVTVAA